MPMVESDTRIVDLEVPGGYLEAQVTIRDGVPIITDLHIRATEIDSAVLEAIKLTQIRNVRVDLAAARTPLPARDPSRGRRGHPASFYGAVADAYRYHAATTGRAATVAIAAEANVPVCTAQRWVSRARQLGFLPPGRIGRTG